METVCGYDECGPCRNQQALVAVMRPTEVQKCRPDCLVLTIRRVTMETQDKAEQTQPVESSGHIQYDCSMSIKVGGGAPDFKLADQDGNWHKLSDYKGKWVVVYFYPKDDTPG